MKQFEQNVTGDTWPADECTPLYARGSGNVPDAYLTPDGGVELAEEVTAHTVFEVWGTVFDDIDAASRVLSESFWDMVGPIVREEFRADDIMAREAFNNWTDNLHEGGEICTDTYEYCELLESRQ